jgi:hypothetical protein
VQRYSKRPPLAEPLPLGTGDFEAVGYPDVPRAPRTPIFHRSPQSQAHGYGFGTGGGYPAHYSQAPAAPHSLSPVTMSSVRDAAATGPQRAQPTVVIRARPTSRTGVMILVAGALIGAVFGIGMRARRNAADAAFARQQAVVQEQQQAVAVLPPPAPVTPIVVSPNGVVAQGPAAVAPRSYANVPFGSLVVSQSPAQPAPAPRSTAAPLTTTAAPAPPPRAPQKHVASWGKPAGGAHPSSSAKVHAQPKNKDDDGYRVASAGDEPNEPAPPRVSKAAKEPAEPKVTKKAEAKPAQGGKVSDDADKVLKAAMGATENTL